MTDPVRVLVWDENATNVPAEIYPRGIRGAVAEGLDDQGLSVECSHIDLPHQGIDPQKIANVDVVIWWGHERHDQITDRTVNQIFDRVHRHGMGFIALHSSHYSRPFREVLAATGHLRGGWDEKGGREEIRVCSPGHPIAEGIEDFALPEEEYYGSPFEVPAPEALIFQSYFPKKDRYFPSGLTWTVGQGITSGGSMTSAGQGRGIGRVFYFRPGHETLPTFHDPNVRKIIRNAVLWAAKRIG